MTLPQSTLDAFTTLEQFRDYFAGIPEELWIEGYFHRDGKCCAEGFLGERCEGTGVIPVAVNTFETLLIKYLDITAVRINDGHAPQFTQPTPRQRILAAIDEAIKRRDEKV